MTAFYYNIYDFQPAKVRVGDSQYVFVQDNALNLKFDKRFALSSLTIEALLKDRALEYDDVLFSDMQEAEDTVFEYKTENLGKFYKLKKRNRFFMKDMQNLEYAFYFPLNIPFEYFRYVGTDLGEWVHRNGYLWGRFNLIYRFSVFEVSCLDLDLVPSLKLVFSY